MTRLARVLRNAWSQPPFWTNPEAPWWATVVGELGQKETIPNSFEGYVRGAYKANGIVFACILARLWVFSEVRFQWRRFEGGRPTELFDSPSLSILERPWPNGTTGDLLARMEQDASLAGNFYATVVGKGVDQRIRRMRADWVTIVTGSPSKDPYDIEARPVAYIYEPKRGPRALKPVILTPAQVAHYAPIPDPEAQWRGMSWLTPIVNEIKADTSATKHKLKFFEKGATLGVAVTYDKTVPKATFDAFVEEFKKTHAGTENAYETLHLGGGADVKVVGADFQQLDFKKTQGTGETRIAAAAGVHPVIVGLSEGLQGSALNAGNYAQVRRRFADGTIRPLWRFASSALETILERPDDRSHLWYEDRDVPFLQQDVKESAEVRRIEAQTISTLVKDGYTPESVVEAVRTGDFRKLEHTGLFSVQLQPPGVNGPSREDEQ